MVGICGQSILFLNISPKKKIKFKFHRWDILRSLPKKSDPMRSYTQKLNNRKYQLVTGAQIIYNLYALVIHGKKN